jgi:hypothetical protein
VVRWTGDFDEHVFATVAIPVDGCKAQALLPAWAARCAAVPASIATAADALRERLFG